MDELETDCRCNVCTGRSRAASGLVWSTVLTAPEKPLGPQEVPDAA